MNDDNSSIDPKDAKLYATFWTVVYLILLPFACGAALFSGMVFDNNQMTVPIGLTIICLIFLIPISIPVSIYLIWSSYERAEYKKTYVACFMPIFTAIAVEFLNALIQIVFNV